MSTSALVPLVGAPPWNQVRQLVLDSVSSEHSRRAYGFALDDFFAWYEAGPRGPFRKALVQEYRAHLEEQKLASSTINLRLAALRKLASEAADNNLLAPETAAGIAKVKGAKRRGVRIGNWLTRDQAEDLLRAPDLKTLKGKRDQALLALLVGAGLRRNEAAILTFEHIQERDGRWVIADLVGKGSRVRTVPIPIWAKVAVNRWAEGAILRTGFVFRPVHKGGQVYGDGMTAQAIFYVVKDYAVRLGLDIAPHDLRRTFAKLAYRGRAPLEQIQLSLGHASIQTTERYLGTQQDLTDAPCDYLHLEVGG